MNLRIMGDKRGTLQDKKKSRMFLAALGTSSYYYEAIMMKNEPIFMKDEVIKTTKGLRS